LLARTLRENNIQTIGQFASLTPTALELIPYLKKPKLENALNYLKAYNPINFEQSPPVTPQRDAEIIVTEVLKTPPPKSTAVKVEESSLSPEHGIPIVEAQTSSKTLVDQAVQLTPSPQIVKVNQTTSPIKTIYASVEQQTTPALAKRSVEFDLEDDSLSGRVFLGNLS
jgi:hypothetical protein